MLIVTFLVKSSGCEGVCKVKKISVLYSCCIIALKGATTLGKNTRRLFFLRLPLANDAGTSEGEGKGREGKGREGKGR